jgi:chemotaxis protein methyltransferase CheR
MKETEIEEIEIDLLLEALFRLYGYDFRRYSKASITRRIRHLLGETGLGRVSEMIPELLNDKSFLEKLVYDFSITVTEMFRDPDFYRAVREQVIPYLKTYPFVKIWHAGCATGEEVYSMAIVLKEEGLYDRATIFATDFNNPALTKAKEGIYSLKDIKRYTLNYQDTGGTSSFSEYYHAQYDSVIMDQSLKKNITFANHNLVTDGTFSEMHLILCRNVLIYFTKTLQDRVLGLFDDSLVHGGFLCLGTKESIRFSDVAEAYETIDSKAKVYQKKTV